MRGRPALAAAGAALLLLALAATAGAARPPSSLVARGDHLYGEYCLSCHGMNGIGTPPPGRQIGAGPGRQQVKERVVAPSLVGVGALAADFYLRTGYMPLQHLGIQPRRTSVFFSDAQIRALIAYVASLGKGPAIPTPHPERGNVSEGQHLFTDNCAGCHQILGQGGYVTGAVPPVLRNATATQIAEAVRIGPYVMPKFPVSKLSNRQVDSIIRYIRYADHPQHPGGWSIGYVGPIPEGLVTWFIAAAVLIITCLAIGTRLKKA